MLSTDFLYKHKNNTTVAFSILAQDESPTRYVLDVMWFNISSKRPPWAMRAVEMITIEKADMVNWEQIPYDAIMSPPKFTETII